MITYVKCFCTAREQDVYTYFVPEGAAVPFSDSEQIVFQGARATIVLSDEKHFSDHSVIWQNLLNYQSHKTCLRYCDLSLNFPYYTHFDIFIFHQRSSLAPLNYQKNSEEQHL